MPSLKATLSSVLLLATVGQCQSTNAGAADPSNVKPGTHGFQTQNLRIEGETNTIFQGSIVSGPTSITTRSGGTHLCNGENDRAHNRAGATPTTALDAASDFAKFPFNAVFNPRVDDFTITSIGGTTDSANAKWAFLVNYHFTTLGGCAYETRPGDEILWAFNATNKAHFLKLEGPVLVQYGNEYELNVTDGRTGAPVQGARVGSKLTNANGGATFTAPGGPGAAEFTATEENSIRSNEHIVAFF